MPLHSNGNKREINIDLTVSLHTILVLTGEVVLPSSKLIEARQRYYFILSSESMENIIAIKVVSIYSEMIWYHFTVD